MGTVNLQLMKMVSLYIYLTKTMILAAGNLLEILQTIASIPSTSWSAELWWLFVPANNTTTLNWKMIEINFQYVFHISILGPVYMEVGNPR